jgi:hypothetical protein
MGDVEVHALHGAGDLIENEKVIATVKGLLSQALSFR